MPKGYRFVPKGNVYITKNCRKNTQAANKTVYVVVESLNTKRVKTLGIRVPADIYGEVVVSPSEDDPTVCLVEFSFAVAHGLNQIYLTAHITV